MSTAGLPSVARAGRAESPRGCRCTTRIKPYSSKRLDRAWPAKRGHDQGRRDEHGSGQEDERPCRRDRSPQQASHRGGDQVPGRLDCGEQPERRAAQLARARLATAALSAVFPAADAQPGEHEGGRQHDGLMAAHGELDVTRSERHGPSTTGRMPWACRARAAGQSGLARADDDDSTADCMVSLLAPGSRVGRGC